MKGQPALLLYQALLPLLFLVAFPGWIVKMLKRGGFGTALTERIGIYFSEKEFEPCGAIHLHAVSVGETALALKLLKAWTKLQPDARFVLATGTATGHHLATHSFPSLRVTYAPIDFPWMVRHYLRRFEPSRIILIEGEVWPNLLRLAEKSGIRVDLANARTSPRSARRLTKFAPLLRPFFSKLSTVCIQEEEHRALWTSLGITPDHIHLTGSLKFDAGSAPPPAPNPAFAEMLASFGSHRPVVLAASTFAGEEEMLARAIVNAAPDALPVIVPRHAERRTEVARALTQAGFNVTLRSSFSLPLTTQPQAFVIDTTGELATWTAHADAVIIGKSFLSHGGQNPAEAIIARKPLILGPNMDNFQPLARHLLEQGGALPAHDETSVTLAVRAALDPHCAADLTSKAQSVLSAHNGATQRHLSVLQPVSRSA